MESNVKTCSKCKEEKPIESFNKEKSKLDGRASRCREKNKEKLLAYGRSDEVVAMQSEYHKAYRQTDRFKEIQDSSRRRNLQEYNSRAKVNYALSTGKLTRQPCEVCGTTEHIHAHHHDYSKPLEVAWLCITHHKALHVDMRMERRAITEI